MEEVKSFYEKLFKNSDSELVDIDIQSVVQPLDIPKLDNITADFLDRDISEREILNVLKGMKNNKSPGSDGFSAEFYKFFWNDLKIYITSAINHIFVHGQLPVSQRLGIISCLPKGDKPRQFLKNWRPITLLNVLYKLISGCISYRIKSTLDLLISNTQTGFIQGRYIGENTRFIYDLMSYTEINNLPGLLMLIDFEKAFDSVSWSFLYKVLHFFGFGNNIIKWVKILNTNFKASILQSGFLSQQFEIQRGCRQGDPVAPYLFILCAEILAILIKQNKDIRGIFVYDREHKISQYADDTSLILDGSASSLFNALETLELFSKISGLQVNSSKTKIVWFGSKKFSSEVFHHSRWKLDWGATEFVLLGIHFSVDLEKIPDLNYDIQIPKIIALIQQWERRILTPIGRITVLKSLIVPKLNHLLISLPNPKKDTITFLNNEFFRFVWKSKCDKVKRSIVTQNFCTGGLKMLNFKNFIISLKCSWIKRVVQGGQSWMSIFKAIFGDIGVGFLEFGDNFIKKLIEQCNNIFWRDVFDAWLNVMNVHSNQISDSNNNIIFSPIWHNSNIKVEKKSMFYKEWYKKGVKTVKDFLHDDGSFLSKSEFEKRFHLNKVCFMQYNSIISAVRKFVKDSNFSKENYVNFVGPFLPFYCVELLLYKKCTKPIYNLINTNVQCIIPNSIIRWNSKIVMRGHSELILQDIFKVCFKVTTDTTVQWLQYRTLHRILPVKSYLKKIKIVDNDICSFCNNEVETIEHVFTSCSFALDLWSSLSMHIYHAVSKRVGFNEYNILFGETPPSNSNLVINFLILYTKQYIFQCLYNKKVPIFAGLLCHLNFRYEIEKCVAIRNSSYDKHNDRWFEWKNLFLNI